MAREMKRLTDQIVQNSRHNFQHLVFQRILVMSTVVKVVQSSSRPLGLSKYNNSSKVSSAENRSRLKFPSRFSMLKIPEQRMVKKAMELRTVKTVGYFCIRYVYMSLEMLLKEGWKMQYSVRYQVQNFIQNFIVRHSLCDHFSFSYFVESV